MIDRQDYERVSQAIALHLRDGHFDFSLSLMRTLRTTLEHVPVATRREMREFFEHTTENVRQQLVRGRQELDEISYQCLLLLFEESITAAEGIKEPVEAAAEAAPESMEAPKLAEGEVYLSTSETAERIGLSTQTILNMIHDGRIKAIRPFGTHYKIPVSQFAEAERNIAEFRQFLLDLQKKKGYHFTEEELDDL